MATPADILPRSSEARKASHPPERHGHASHNVQVQLNYLKDVVYFPKLIQITPSFLDAGRRTNVQLEQGPRETIQDVRGREREFSLDTHGFQYLHAPTDFQEWTSNADIARYYFSELETLLVREVGGCDEIMFYDARIRHADDIGRRIEGLSYSPWAMQVHCDNTEKSVLSKMKDMSELKHPYLLSGRVRIINIWRPIRHPVFDCGLAVADSGKLQAGDVIECDRHRQDTGEYWDTMGVVKFREGFDWYFKYQQSEDDVLLFKNYDSSSDVAARTCLHTAFQMPQQDIPTHAPSRESIEVRAAIFTYPDNVEQLSTSRKLPLTHASSQGAVKIHSHELRTDIDEGNEIKDAMLMLRKREIKRLEEEKESLVFEREKLAAELKRSQARVEALLARTGGTAEKPGRAATSQADEPIEGTGDCAGSA